MNDKLIGKLNNGDERAFEQIVAKYGGYLISVVNRRSGGLLSYEDAEEIASDTFAALWRERARIDPEKPLMPYLAAVAGNLVISRLRVLRLSVSIEDSGEPAIDDLVRDTENREAFGCIPEALSELTDKQREVFVRFYFYGEALKEIEGVMNISPSDTRTTLHRAREKVREYLIQRGHSYE